MSRPAKDEPTPVPPKTPRAKRPARNILAAAGAAAKTVRSGKKEIYIKNSVLSPLLRLPPEIRTLIWEFTLGRKTIHVSRNYSHDEFVLARSICRTSTTDGEHAANIKSHPSGRRQSSQAEIHRDCCCNADEDHFGKRLNLLRVCRQIYEEAALLPYSGNHFSFLGLSALENFLSTLIPAQAHAIRSLSYTRRAQIARDANLRKSTNGNWFLKRLPNVKELICFVEFARDWRVEAFNGREVRKKLEADRIRYLDRLPVQKATVVAYVTEAEALEGEASSEEVLDGDEVVRWEADVQAKLTAQWDAREALRKQEERAAKREADALRREEERRERVARNRSSGGRLRSQRLLEDDLDRLVLTWLP